jgi:hypothetical protein
MGSVRLYLEGLYRTQLFSNGWNNMVTIILITCTPLLLPKARCMQLELVERGN